MDFFRTARNPWGEEVFLGLAWDLFWLVVLAGAVFIVVHAFFARRRAAKAAARVPAADGRIPERITRHGKSARISHWILAIAVLTLLVTGLVPILGLGFPWVTIHWVAGIVLGVYVLYHTVDTVVRRSLGSMLWFYPGEIRESIARLKAALGGGGDPVARPGKWGVENKLFHHLTAIAGLAAVVTGLLMMVRVDTWFWSANPYTIFSDQQWGVVFIIHGVSALAFVGLLMAHIYFAVRPTNFWISRSMFLGWIRRDEFLAHHDPRRWPVPGAGVVEEEEPAPEPVPAGGAPPEHSES